MELMAIGYSVCKKKASLILGYLILTVIVAH